VQGRLCGLIIVGFSDLEELLGDLEGFGSSMVSRYVKGLKNNHYYSFADNVIPSCSLSAHEVGESHIIGGDL
jgi:hypothetical protein